MGEGRTQSQTGVVSGGCQDEVVCLDGPTEIAMDTQNTGISVLSKDFSGNATVGVSSGLFGCTENPTLFSADNAGSLKVFDDSRTGERCPNTDTVVSTAACCDVIASTRVYEPHDTYETHTPGKDSQPKKKTQSMKLLCRIGLSNLTLGGSEDDSEVNKVHETDQPENPVAIRRNRKRVCRTSQRVSSRNSKRSKQSMEMPDTGETLQDTNNVEQPMASSFPSDGSTSSLGDTTPDAESSLGCSEEQVKGGEDELNDEVDCPMPSTAQQKEARRLARLRQLKEMRARETMEARRERALKRRGEQSPSKQRTGSSAKTVSWKEECSLARVMEYDFMS